MQAQRGKAFPTTKPISAGCGPCIKKRLRGSPELFTVGALHDPAMRRTRCVMTWPRNFPALRLIAGLWMKRSTVIVVRSVKQELGRFAD